MAYPSVFGAPGGTRTPDTLLKRQVLYLLSYWGASSEQASDRLASAKDVLAPAFSPNRKTRSAFDLERKKEITDTALSRLLRKPRKQSGVSFF